MQALVGGDASAARHVIRLDQGPAFIMCVGMCIWRAALLAHAAELPRSGARARSAPRGARPLARAAEIFSGYSGPGVVRFLRKTMASA